MNDTAGKFFGAEDALKLEKAWEEPLHRYSELLASCSVARLTGSRDADEIYELHIRDSLYSVPLLPEEGEVIDVGSGGGLPGVVWAICRPGLSVTLLDSVRKKCAALRDIAAALELKNISTVWGRCEEYALSARERYSFAAARALAHAGVVAEYLAPLVARGGRLIAFKGPKGAAELEEVGEKWNRLGLSQPRVLSYAEGRNYFFVVWEKNSPCPSFYPRKPGLALSKNWWK